MTVMDFKRQIKASTYSRLKIVKLFLHYFPVLLMDGVAFMDAFDNSAHISLFHLLSTLTMHIVLGNAVKEFTLKNWTPHIAHQLAHDYGFLRSEDGQPLPNIKEVYKEKYGSCEISYPDFVHISLILRSRFIIIVSLNIGRISIEGGGGSGHGDGDDDGNGVDGDGDDGDK